MTSGRTSRLARLHRDMVERAKTQEQTIAGLRAKLAEATNDAYRVHEELGSLRDRLERVEAAQAPTGYRGRFRA